MGDFAEFNDDGATDYYFLHGGEHLIPAKWHMLFSRNPWASRDESSQKHYPLEKLGVNNLLGERET